MLPFTERDSLDVFAAYNLALWPGGLALWVVQAGLAVRLWLGGTPHRALSFLLAAMWGWSALAYHAAFFTRINPAAWVFAAAFLFQAVLFLRAGLRRTPLLFTHGGSVRHLLSAALITYGLAYPMLVLFDGLTFPRMPTFGVPCPTALVTAGFLLAGHRPPWTLAVIPIAWSLIGGSAAVLLGVRPDLALFAAAAALLLQQVAQRRHPRQMHASSTLAAG
jgi:hypothetical protein